MEVFKLKSEGLLGVRQKKRKRCSRHGRASTRTGKPKSMSSNCKAIELHKKLQSNLIQLIAENAQKCKEMRNESSFRILCAKLRNLKSSAE